MSLGVSGQITFFGQGLAKGFGLAKGTLVKGILAHSGFSGLVRHMGEGAVSLAESGRLQHSGASGSLHGRHLGFAERDFVPDINNKFSALYWKCYVEFEFLILL